MARVESLIITLKEATENAHIMEHEQYIMQRFEKEKNIIILDYKKALTFHPGMWEWQGKKVMGVRVECTLGPYAVRK